MSKLEQTMVWLRIFFINDLKKKDIWQIREIKNELLATLIDKLSTIVKYFNMFTKEYVFYIL